MTRDEAATIARNHFPGWDQFATKLDDSIIAAIMEAHATGLERAAVAVESINTYRIGQNIGAACAAAIRALAKGEA